MRASAMLYRLAAPPLRKGRPDMRLDSHLCAIKVATTPSTGAPLMEGQRRSGPGISYTVRKHTALHPLRIASGRLHSHRRKASPRGMRS